MIQRIQTVFLGVIVMLGIVFSFVPVLAFNNADLTYVMNAYKTVAINDMTIVVTKNMGVGVLQGMILLLALVIIFLYKNRQLQLKLAKLNILLIAFQIAAIVMYSDAAKTAMNLTTSEVAITFKLGSIIPLLSLIFTYLTIHFIKKDDQLVRAANRLR